MACICNEKIILFYYPHFNNVLGYKKSFHFANHINSNNIFQQSPLFFNLYYKFYPQIPSIDSIFPLRLEGSTLGS